MREVIEELFEEDIDDRIKLEDHKVDWDFVSRRDNARLETAKAILENDSQNLTPEEMFRLSLIFQHTGTTEEVLIGHNLAKTSYKLGFKKALWMVCASWDRYLVWSGKDQVYGTQRIIPFGGKEEVCKIDASITDDQLRVQGLPTKIEYQSTLGQNKLK